MTDITVSKTAEDIASKDLRVTVPAERVQAAEAKALKYYAQRAKLPGFRPGKAPEAVVRKRFQDAIRQAVLEELLQESWKTVQDSEKLEPIADPAVRNLKFEDGSALEFDLHVEVKPKITLSRIGGFSVQREVEPVGAEQVTEQLDKLREQKAAWIPLDGEKPAEGNLVRVEVTPVGEGAKGEAQSYELVIGQGQTLPELEETITTLAPGESAEVDVKERRLRVEVKEVKRQELPALDDAFAREVGDFDGLEALRGAIRADLEASATREADARVRQELLKQIVEANEVPAPESMIHRLMHAYAHMYQVPQEQLGAFESQFHGIAEEQVKRDLVLESVMEQQNLRATEEEIDARVAEIAEARGVPAGQVYASLQKANRLAELERAITEEKVFGYLLEQSTVSETTS
jgi:trigger factor